jgi:aminopeptidase N
MRDGCGVETLLWHDICRRTGNRVTCRDWFQLTLKEGLTVFRVHPHFFTDCSSYANILSQDQEFSSDMNCRSVCRVKAVQFLRDCQFDEGDVPCQHARSPAANIATVQTEARWRIPFDPILTSRWRIFTL